MAGWTGLLETKVPEVERTEIAEVMSFSRFKESSCCFGVDESNVNSVGGSCPSRVGEDMDMVDDADAIAEADADGTDGSVGSSEVEVGLYDAVRFVARSSSCEEA